MREVQRIWVRPTDNRYGPADNSSEGATGWVAGLGYAWQKLGLEPIGGHSWGKGVAFCWPEDRTRVETHLAEYGLDVTGNDCYYIWEPTDFTVGARWRWGSNGARLEVTGVEPHRVTVRMQERSRCRWRAYAYDLTRLHEAPPPPAAAQARSEYAVA